MSPNSSENKRTRVDVERIRFLEEELRKINALDFESIDFYEGGQKLDIPAERLHDWKFVGMVNSDFIDTGFYKEGWTEVWKNVDGELTQVNGAEHDRLRK